MNEFCLLNSRGQVDYKLARAYFDLAIELTKSSGENASVLNYAIKVLANQVQNLTENAKVYSWKMSMHLCLLYPYLISLMDENVFKPFGVPGDEIQKFINLAYKDGLANRNYEECSYAIYFALKYGKDVNDIDASAVASTNDCIYKILSYLYFHNKGDSPSIESLKDNARNLAKTDMDGNWLFVYEVLSYDDFSCDKERTNKGKKNGQVHAEVEEWKTLKKKGVSFLDLTQIHSEG